MFALKNMGGDEWQDKQHHEHTGTVRHRMMTHEEALAEAQRRGLPTQIFEP